VVRAHVSHYVLKPSRRAGGNLLSHEHFDGSKIHRFVNQNIGPFG
jgi:hypothetical protein